MISFRRHLAPAARAARADRGDGRPGSASVVRITPARRDTINREDRVESPVMNNGHALNITTAFESARPRPG